jgi:hypothetical protein
MRGRTKRIFYVLFLSFIMLIASISTVYGAEEERIKISHSYGFENVFKWGSLIPVTIEIDNNLKNIDGEIQIEIPVNDNQNGGINMGDSVTVYSQNINLPLNTKKKVTINIPMARNVSSLKMNILEGKNNIFSKDLSIGAGLNPTDIIIGTLSDDFNSVSYINKISVDGPNIGKRIYNTKLVKLDENSLSEDLNVLKPLNILLINNFDTSKISKAKYETIKQWVENGGFLLIGTGPSHNKTLAIFKDNFLNGDIGTIANLETKSINKLVDSSSTNSMKLDVLNIGIKDSSSLLAEGNTTLVQRLEKGKGAVVVAGFDFGLSPLANWPLNSSFGEQLIGQALPDYYKDNGYDRIAYGGASGNISYSLGNIPELPTPNASSLIIIFFIYILIVAPVNYFILKKKDKREFMWFTVPALSIIFAAIVYFAGAPTRMTAPVANVLSTIEIDSKGNQLVQSYGTVITPKKSDIKVEPQEGMSIRPLANLEYSDRGMAPNGNDSKKEKSIYSKVTQSPKTTLEFYNTGVFGQYSFIINSDEARKGTIQSEVNFSDNKLTGSIKNNSGLDLDDCYIITSNNYVSIGAIKNGEVKNINEPTNAYTGMYYELMDKMFGIRYGGTITDFKQIKERRIAEQKRALMQYYFESTGGKITNSIILAITESPVTKDILVNEEAVKKYGKTLVVSQLNLTYIKDGKAEYPAGSIQPEVKIEQNGKLGYDQMAGIIHGESGVVEFNYYIDPKVKVEKLELKEAESDPRFGKFGAIQGKGYAFNSTKNDWEEIDYKSFSIGEDKVSQYLTKENSFKLKIDVIGMQGAGTIPQIYVKGSVK